MIDRSNVSRALAKAIAFKNCGKDNEAKAWAYELVLLLQCADILAPIDAQFRDEWISAQAGRRRT